MSIASGYSIQRNDIIDVPHRSQVETHNALSGSNTYFLRSRPDVSDKDWEWDIRIGETRFYLNRGLGNNSMVSGVTATDAELYKDKVYVEGSTSAGQGSIRYDSALGEFGGIVFAEEVRPISGEIIEIKYIEHVTHFTGSDGGLLFQLAHDLTVHPFEFPEIFNLNLSRDVTFDTDADGTPGNEITSDFTTSEILNEIDTGTGNLTAYQQVLPVQYNRDYSEDGTPADQLVAGKLWKVVREHKVVTELNLGSGGATPFASIDPSDSNTWPSIIGDFPLTISDLGSGEFRVSLNGRVLPSEDWIATSNNVSRSTLFKFKRTEVMPWVSDLSQCVFTISYHWGKTIDVPYGALVGPGGLGPQQETLSGGANDYSWPKNNTVDTDYWAYSKATTSDGQPTGTAVNGFVAFFYDQTTDTPNIADAITASGQKDELATTEEGTSWMLTFQENDNFQRPFDLIYPTPVSNDKEDVKDALRRITNGFLVESNKGVDLLSDTNLSFASSLSPSAVRKPQKWRMRFEWNDDERYLKVNVATSYQLKDDFTISQPQGRDGIKNPVYREPGELCDVYSSPMIGRGAILQMSKAKSQWFRKTQIEDSLSTSYPMSYRLTVTNHGLGLFLFDHASVDQDDDYAWLVVQRHVDQTTGQPEFAEKSPVHCVYSPCKRPVDVASLTPYFASQDLDDLSKPGPIQNSLGQVFRSEAPTIFVNRDLALFNGIVNAIDFNPIGYATGGTTTNTLGQLYYNDIRSDLTRGFTGTGYAENQNLWSLTAHRLQIDRDITVSTAFASSGVRNVEVLTPGKFIAQEITDAEGNITRKGGRIVAYNKETGRLIIAGHVGLTLERPPAAEGADPDAPPSPLVLKEGTSGSGDVSIDFTAETTGDFVAIPLDGPTGNTFQEEFQHAVFDLQIQGFNSLPRRKDVAFTTGASPSPSAVEQIKTFTVTAAVPPATDPTTTTTIDGLEHYDRSGEIITSSTAVPAQYVMGSNAGVSLSENVAFPQNLLERMSTFKYASRSGDGVPTSDTSVGLVDYKSADSALLDILYSAPVANMDKVFESMVIALDDVEIIRDKSAYILSYDEWVSHGDPSTVQRFVESLDAAGVTTIGSDFRVPSIDGTTIRWDNVDVATKTLTVGDTNPSTGRNFFYAHAGAGSANQPTYALVGANHAVQSSVRENLLNKMPGDPVWTDQSSLKNEYMYDFFNQTLYFKVSPRAGAELTISIINYVTSNPAQGAYIITIPEDRDFPERNMNEVKTINRFVVREQDVLKPWDFHVSATMHEIDSHAVINPMEQLSITQDRNFVFSFPTQITTQRFYYPQSELDIICISSADFSTQSGHVEINKYDDSDGVNEEFRGGSFVPASISSTSPAEVTRYAGHEGPDGVKYIWRKNARKYEGMSATLPNGNGMRVFMQVTGSSIRYSDVTPGTAPGSTLGS